VSGPTTCTSKLHATDTLGYIHRLFEPGDWIDLQFIHQTEMRPGTNNKLTDDNFMLVENVTEETIQHIRISQDKGWNSYIAMNAFTPGLQRRRKVDVQEVRNVYIEFDENSQAGLDAIFSDVNSDIIPPPTFTLRSSQGKAYVIWKVRDFTIAQQEAVNSALQKRYGSDPQSVDVVRILRLPGTRNLKYDPPQVVTIVDEDEESFVRWSPEDFKIEYTVKKSVKHAAAPDKQRIRLAFYEQACQDAEVDPGTCTEKDGSYRYEVECPNFEEHSDKTKSGASVMIYPSGKISFSCWHAHCKHLDWTTFYRPWVEEKAKEAGFEGFLKFGEAAEVESSVPLIDCVRAGALAAKDASAAVLATAPASKRLTIQTASKVVTKKVQWLWKHRVPLGKLTLFVGVPGSGKSLCAGDVAARLSTGADWFDAENTFKPSETLMLVGEDDVDDTTTPRLEAAGADLSKIHFVKSVITDEGKSDTPEDREIQFDKDLVQIEDHLKANPNIRLIIVDPVSNYMGAAKMNAEQEVRAVLIPLKNLAERRGVSIIAVMHLNKKSDTSAINRVGGAMAFVGVARAAYLFQASDHELEEGAVNRLQQHFMVLLKCNITKKVDGLVYEIPAKPVTVEGSDEWMPIIRFIGTTTTNAEGLLQQKSESRGRPTETLTTAKAWLREFLMGGPKPSGEIIKAGKELQNLSARTIERAKISLNVISGKDGKTWLWSLPKQHDAINLDLQPEGS
jgi:hypothetical protein